jgi:Coenzyme PQQ synthesis protein D (PqqD)
MKHDLSEFSTVVAANDQVSSDLGGEVAILNLRAGMYYGLDDVGARVWQLLQEPTVVGDLQATIAQEYEVEPTRASDDVIALLSQMADEGLIEVENESSS